MQVRQQVVLEGIREQAGRKTQTGKATTTKKVTLEA